MIRHYDADSCPADSIMSLLNSSLKTSSLSCRFYFSHIYSRNINVYDDIKIETSLCFSSVVRRLSTDFSDNRRMVTASAALDEALGNITQSDDLRKREYLLELS